MAHRKIHQISLGLPITETRAQELAEIIAGEINAGEAMDALAELILGIAPLYDSVKEFPEANRFSFEIDLSCRQIAAKYALAALFECSEAFRDAFERYAQEHSPEQTLLTMEEVLGFEDPSVARKLLDMHAPAKEKTVTKEKATKRASKQRRAEQ
jgi:hypothetical protein